MNFFIFYFIIIIFFILNLSCIYSSTSLQKISFNLLTNKSYKKNSKNSFSTLLESPYVNKYVRQFKSLFSSNLEALVLKLTEPTTSVIDQSSLDELVEALKNSPVSLSVETIIKLSRKLKEKNSYTQLKTLSLLHYLSIKMSSNLYIIKNLLNKKDTKLFHYYFERYDLLLNNYILIFKKKNKNTKINKKIKKNKLKFINSNEILYARVLPYYEEYLAILFDLQNNIKYDEKNNKKIEDDDENDNETDENHQENDEIHEDEDDENDEEDDDEMIKKHSSFSTNYFSSPHVINNSQLLIKKIDKVLTVLSECSPSKLRKQIRNLLVKDKEKLLALGNLM